MRALVYLFILVLTPICRAASWEPYVWPENQVFPSLLFSASLVRGEDALWTNGDTPVLGNETGIIGVHLTEVSAGKKVKVTVLATFLWDESSVEATVPTGATEVDVMPEIAYHFDKLTAVKQQTPLVIKMNVAVDGKSLGEKSQVVAVRSINDCPYGVTDGEEEIDLSWMFAGYVNEGHPYIGTLTRDALESGIVDSFDAYQSEEGEQVYLQVYAIWDALQKKGIRYSDITTTASESETVYSQAVRFLDESIANKQANCVDGSCLLASVLRKIGITSQLVLIPGHMFLAFDIADGETVGLETTMLGDTGEDKIKRPKWISKDKFDELKENASFRSFAGAISLATKELKKSAAKFEDESELEYQMIDLAEARRMGLTPIPFTEKASGD